jgi:hypothetical protein
MAIQSVDDIIASTKQSSMIFKATTGVQVAGRPYSLWYTAGIPGAGAAPSAGANGANLTSPVDGQIPFANTASMASYLGRWTLGTLNQTNIWLCDRLWANSGLPVTSTALQSITQPTLPARDANGATAGVGVMVGIEVSSNMGAAAPSPTLTYTNSAGTTGKTATLAYPVANSAQAGAFYPFALAAGDVGVRAVEGYQNNISWVSGAIHLVAYRVIAQLECHTPALMKVLDPVTGLLPRIYDDSVLFLIAQPPSTSGYSTYGHITIVAK